MSSQDSIKSGKYASKEATRSGTHSVAIVGAGLVGSLLAIYLAKRGYQVSVFERRADMRIAGALHGRSINLALSNRGIRALEEVGLAEELKKVAIPMNGRTMHDLAGKLSFLPYGRQGQFINSISRSNLNIVLMNHAEQAGVQFYFNHRCIHINFEQCSLHLLKGGGSSAFAKAMADASAYAEATADKPDQQNFDLIIGADGAFSSVRWAMQNTERFNYSQSYIEHGYKEFHIPPGASGKFLMEKNSLHIWPRESFMMIALPNPDGSFTATLFFPIVGESSFNSLHNDQEVTLFLQKQFPDAVALMPGALEDYHKNPISSLLTVKCYPWVKNKVLLIGDAAHGIVPFYGQGMNAGFEDCRILNQLLDEHDDNWDRVLPSFQELRKPDADAIAQLALGNFVEMRDLVADADFLLRKKIEARLHELYPEKWIPLYSMVTFHDHIRYSDAQATGQKQKEIMDRVMKMPGIESNWNSLDFGAIANQLEAQPT